MSLKSYIQLAILLIFINIGTVFTSIYAVWSVIYLVFALFIVSNRDADKLLQDKKIIALMQAFILCCVTFIFTVMGFSLFPLIYIVQTNLATFYYPLLLIGIVGLIGFYYLFIKLLIETIHIMKQKEH